jgi:hypothetical protein
MNKVSAFLLVLVTIFTHSGCKEQRNELNFTNKDISKVIDEMTELMIHDVTNPPLASRFFSYACLAGYEIISQNDSRFIGFHGILNDYPEIKKPDSIATYSYKLAALLSMIETAKKLQPSGSLLEKYQTKLLDSCKDLGYSAELLEQSQQYALLISKKILAYAKSDGYNKISNYRRYTPLDSEGTWYPTPPAYISAVEPYFNTVRPFTLDSCSQFKPASPIPFSKDKNSAFYQLMLLNYKSQLSEEHKTIAAFWDCNPFAVQDEGHMMIGLKKISPGAHWLGITGIACGKSKKSFNETLQIYATVSIGLMDGFICCWDEKYRSNRIRPETAIRKYIDPNWAPFIQTPPFPEYLSGHSVISSSSATILSHYFGDNFSYTDSVEVPYGLKPRSFSSFNEAAQEAAVSRFYGGIHFMDAIDNGLVQGKKVGTRVLERLFKKAI